MDRSRVLIVEDEPDLAWVERFNLEIEGYDVEVALEGRSAIAALDSFKPHLLVLDVMLPQVDGWAVLAHAAELPDPERPKVIVVSALPGIIEQWGHGRGLQVELFLAKPFEMEDLVRAVDQALNAA